MGVVLFRGGPLDSLLERLGLGGTSNRQIGARIAFWVSITWLPLLLLSTVARLRGVPTPSVSFLADFPVHVRFLIALPVLIGAERHVQGRISETLPILLEREILPADVLPQVRRSQTGIHALRDSKLAEALLLLLAIGVVESRVLLALPPTVTTWQLSGDSASTLARHWYQDFSLVVYHFLLLRWLWRYALWCGFLFRLARLRLNLNSHHPDRLGGLSFLLLRHVRFGVIATMFSTVASANIAELALYSDRPVSSFETTIAAYLLLVTSLFMGPLLMFSPNLSRTKREGMHRYGNLATRYTNFFLARWSPQDAQQAETLLGTPDIQSLGDLGGSYDLMRRMSTLLMSRRQFISLMTFAAGPLTPLILFEIPLVELLKKVASTFI